MNEFQDLGKQIQESVQRAVNSRDFEELNRNIAATADIALREVVRGLDTASRTLRDHGFAGTYDEGLQADRTSHNGGAGSDTAGRYSYDNTSGSADRQYSDDSTERSASERYSYDNTGDSTAERYSYSNSGNSAGSRYSYDDSGRANARRSPYQSWLNRDKFRRRSGTADETLYNPRKGRVAAPLWLLFGGLFTASFGVTLLLMFALWLTDFEWVFAALTFGLFLPLTVVSLAVLGKGFSVLGRNRRARLYWNCLGDRRSIPLAELAAVAGKGIRYVRKDLRRMIHLGYFPQALLDDVSDSLFLDRETYRLHRESPGQRRQTVPPKPEPAPEISPEIREVMEEGVRVLKQIREANDELPGEEVSAKLDRLETVVRKIFEVVTATPSKLPDIRRFIQYYLPTTCKLVSVYRDFDRQTIQTETIVKSKEEILKTLDTINAAFEKLLDGLYADTAMDVSSDISVLRTMLAQEGLTDSSLHKNYSGS